MPSAPPNAAMDAAWMSSTSSRVRKVGSFIGPVSAKPWRGLGGAWRGWPSRAPAVIYRRASRAEHLRGLTPWETSNTGRQAPRLGAAGPWRVLAAPVRREGQLTLPGRRPEFTGPVVPGLAASASERAGGQTTKHPKDTKPKIGRVAHGTHGKHGNRARSRRFRA